MINTLKINTLTIPSVKLCSLLLALSLGACGGGGSTVTPTTPTPTTPTPVTTTLDQQFSLYLIDLSQNHILPGYQLLADNAASFADKSQAFCAVTEPSQLALDLLRLSWLEVNLQWQTMQWLRKGVISANNRHLRLQFWPDSQGAVTVGLNNLLNHPEVVDVQYVADHNVGGQGIPAAERLLFPTDDADSLLSAANKAKRCEVLKAISRNIANISDEVNQAWQPSGGNYVNTLINGASGASDTEQAQARKNVIEDLVTNWLEQLENIKDEKVKTPLGTSAPGDLDKSEFYRSHASLAAIKINLNLFKQIYSAGDGHGFDKILQDHLQQSNIQTSMSSNLDNLVSKVNAMQGTLEEMLADDANRLEVSELISAIQDFRTVLTADFVQALDINIGFNSNDGD